MNTLDSGAYDKPVGSQEELSASPIPFSEAVRVWAIVALYSFGGPSGQIGIMHRILVHERRWISDDRFNHALSFCMLLPGPEAQQLATYSGWLLHRVRRGLIAGGLFILPGFMSILVLSVLYARYESSVAVQALFYGLKPAVLAIVVAALYRLSRNSLHGSTRIGIAALAFGSLFLLDLPFPLVIAAAGVVGLIQGKLNPQRSRGEVLPESQPLPSVTRTTATALVWLAIWFAPLLLLLAVVGEESVFVQQGLFFSKAAVVTFGGAYAVLAYVAQQAVDNYGWLQPGEMLDGLGMAETTPGPLIQVVQFVGFMGTYRFASGIDPVLAGIIGSVVVTWVTFVPSFLWIFVGAPYVEYLRSWKSLNSALAAVTAAVVGVMLNLALWFAMHTLFATVREVNSWGMTLNLPDPETLDVAALAIAVAAGIAMLRFRTGMITTIAASAAAGALYYMIA